MLPTGEGLLAWNSIEEIVGGMEDIEARYELHTRRAREIALDHFRDSVVLPPLLDRALA